MTMVQLGCVQTQPLYLPSADKTPSMPMRDSLPGNASMFNTRGLPPQVPPVPRQYAPHPLSRHDSYRSQPSGSEDSREYKAPEHMLRRKTPNGILAAAYDGTSVEEMEKPHATKHILLTSADSSSTYGLQKELPLRSPAVYQGLGHVQQMETSEWSPSLYFKTGSGGPQDAWKAMGQPVPQIDSMLNQIPPLQPRPQYNAYGPSFWTIDAALRSQGPTISNDQGPYGPYWPNGTFIPYRPAALRDPRYDPHTDASWHSQPFGSWPNTGFNNPPFNMNNAQQSPFPLPSPQHTYPNLGVSMNYPLSAGLPRPHHQSPSEFATPSSGQTTPVPDGTFPFTSPFDFGPNSQNAQSRERVFAWAHNVYRDLLKYFQSTRKPNPNIRNPQGQQHMRPHIYPKPPRQPSTSYAQAPSANAPPLAAERTNSLPMVPTYPNHNFVDLQRPSQPNPTPTYPSHEPTHQRASSMYSFGANIQVDAAGRQAWPPIASQQYSNPNMPMLEPVRPLRRMSGASVAGFNQTFRHETPPSMIAASALDLITKHCEESKWEWVDGILLGGCLAYALGDYQKAQEWYKHILKLDEGHVEAISNLAATSLALQQRQDAERYWRKAVHLRPSYFEAVEHLIGLLCGDNRGQEAVKIIEEVERALKMGRNGNRPRISDLSEASGSTVSQPLSISEVSDRPVFDYEAGNERRSRGGLEDLPRSELPGFASSGYAIPGSENGRMLSLAHAKGNMCYGLGDNLAAAKAFEQAVLIAAGPRFRGIGDLIKHILSVVGYDAIDHSPGGRRLPPNTDPVLLHPDPALKTAMLCFPPHGELPGLSYVPNDGMAKKAAISTTSNSLLSLAKIFQDGMASNSPKASAYQSAYGVREILALYYLSLALQPSPSTANNVGILLANVQHSAPSRHIPIAHPTVLKPAIAGLTPGSGIALALAYYNYGLLLDNRHAHLYTNLGSLLKDIGQLDIAISMYEQAVNCDGNFDIALANLGNAVKDKGRISDAIMYYRRAVKASPDFAEAVCGLANALNSVCDWNGRGGIANDGGSRDRWHVTEKGMLLDARLPGASSSGWIKRVVDLVEKQLADGEDWGRGAMDEPFLSDMTRPVLLTDGNTEKPSNMRNTLVSWKQQKWEGARIVRLVERATRRIAWQWYHDRRFGTQRPPNSYKRPQLPAALTIPAAPTVLPFHTFTCPMSAKQIRLISQRNGLRISCSTLKAPWLPVNVYAPPPPPQNGLLHVGYVSSDFNNHPLAHLMQSVFGLHNPRRVKAFCYATTASDGSIHRQQIEREAPVFYDANNWTAQRLVNQIVEDKIHILINLNGYTRGARNEVFAARPAPVQMSFMGFAGTLGAEWCDYLLADDTAVPPDTLRSWRRNVDMEDAVVDDNSGGTEDHWIYGENIIYCRDTFFCCDHRQSAPDAQGPQLNWEEEQQRRWAMRKEIFPQIPDNAIILGNFNQLYKVGISPLLSCTVLTVVD